MKKILAFLATALTVVSLHATTVEMIVPYPPGGTTDLVSRALQQEINRRTDLKVVVSNRPGGSGIVGGQYFLSNPGNRIFMTATGTSLFLKLTDSAAPFDAVNDFQIIGPVATSSTALVVSEKSPIMNLDDFVKQAQSRNLNCGSSNTGASFLAAYFANSRSLKITTVPYKGSAPVLTDLLGGHVDCAFDGTPVYIGREGVRFIAVSTADSSVVPNVPVLAQGDYKFEAFYAMALSKGMDPQVRNKIIEVASTLHQDPEFVKTMAARGVLVNRRFDLNFNNRLNKDFKYLQELDQKFQITKK
jgi:tripartite-type tricarboxylate transporter receptor subunit TctC